jgi:hypothetical protein
MTAWILWIALLSQNSAANGVPAASATGGTTLHADAREAEQTGFAISRSTELYSESFYRADVGGALTQTRLRHEAHHSPSRLALYLGVALERMIFGQETNLIENSVSPMLGFHYRPLAFLTAWIEHRQRFQERTSQSSARSSGDPRAGLALGKNWIASSSLYGLDLYGESVLIPRLHRAPVSSAYARAYIGTAGPAGRFDFYNELNGYQSWKTEAFGPSRANFRVGLRWSAQWRSWQASLSLYRPILLATSSPSRASAGAEGLLVIGGTFQ